MKVNIFLAGFLFNSVGSRVYAWFHTGIWPSDTIFPMILLLLSMSMHIALKNELRMEHK